MSSISSERANLYRIQEIAKTKNGEFLVYADACGIIHTSKVNANNSAKNMRSGLSKLDELSTKFVVVGTYKRDAEHKDLELEQLMIEDCRYLGLI